MLGRPKLTEWRCKTCNLDLAGGLGSDAARRAYPSRKCLKCFKASRPSRSTGKRAAQAEAYDIRNEIGKVSIEASRLHGGKIINGARPHKKQMSQGEFREVTASDPFDLIGFSHRLAEWISTHAAEVPRACACCRVTSMPGDLAVTAHGNLCRICVHYIALCGHCPEHKMMFDADLASLCQTPPPPPWLVEQHAEEEAAYRRWIHDSQGPLGPIEPDFDV